MKEFNVIIEDNGEFKSYDIMPYLRQQWYKFLLGSKIREESENSYWKKPETFKDYLVWVSRELRYMYWGRCQYEMILMPWPPKDTDKGRKIDIWEQCEMNIDLITEVFIENIAEVQDYHDNSRFDEI